MADSSPSPEFKVVPTGHAKKKIQELGTRAKQCGEFPKLQQELLQLAQKLSKDPLAGAGVLLPTGGKEFVECFAFHNFLSIHYLVYEQRKIVEILEIETLPGHFLD
jgi:hypothetical protein